jgi:hypothetical protein
MMNMTGPFTVNFRTGKLEPIRVDDKNDLPIGTVLHLNGYDCPDYAIIGNMGISEHFPGMGTKYLCVNLDDHSQIQKEASSLMWERDKTNEKIQTYITDKILSPEVLEAVRITSETFKTEKQERARKAEEHRQELIKKGKELFETFIPAEAVALIIAENHQDESDLMTDYFNHSISKVVILGWSKHGKDLFKEMRAAALKIPETEHLGPGKGHFSPTVNIGQDFQDGSYYHKGSYSHWHQDLDRDEHSQHLVFSTRGDAENYIKEKGEPYPISFSGQLIPFYWEIEDRSIEHREKYSMGNGYYLKDGFGNSSGWAVRKAKKWNDKWDESYFVSIAERCVFHK